MGAGLVTGPWKADAKTWESWGVPAPTPELVFDTVRKWRFDWAWPTWKVALEIQGGTWRKGGGAHRGLKYLRDIEKFNTAASLGWYVLQATPEMAYTQHTLAFVKACIERRRQSFEV
jgi:hypothetical protein